MWVVPITMLFEFLLIIKQIMSWDEPQELANSIDTKNNECAFDARMASTHRACTCTYGDDLHTQKN